MFYVRIVPPLILVAVLAGLAWVLLVKSQWRGAEFWLIGASTVGMIFVAVLSQAVNAPLNDQLMTWSIAAPPSNFRELWLPWEDAHIIRTSAAVIAFVLAVLGLAFKASKKPG